MSAVTVPVTIVVNTLDRALYLRRLLGSFHHLTYERFEVVVVNGPSRDETDGVLVEFADRIKVARCPEANLSRSRNVGIVAAAGDIVVFIDDDTLPGTPDWLDRIVAPFMEDQRLGACGGPVYAEDSDHCEFAGGATSDYGLQLFGQSPPEHESHAPRWVRGVPGGNSAFRRDVLLQVGGFDEQFPYYLEETDLCLRIVRAGWDVRFEPTAFIRHYRAPRGRYGRVFHDRDWRMVARSDTYYALKNGADPLPQRIFHTLRLVPRKHFVRDIGRWRREGLYGFWRWVRYLGRCLRGISSGLWLGLTGSPRSPLRPTGPAPPSLFRPFPRAQQSRSLRVGLLARVYPPHRRLGGIARYTQELAHALHALGHEVHVFTEGEPATRREGIRLFVHGVVSDPSPLYPLLPMTDRIMRWSVAVADRVIELARAGTPLDVVESPNWESEGVALQRTGLVPVVLRVVSPLAIVAATERWPRTVDLRLASGLERWSIGNADGVTTPTSAVVGTVREAVGVDPLRRRYRAITLGLPPRPIAPPAAKQRLLFVGRLERRKGVDTLFAVLPQLLERHPDLHVDIVGDDSVAIDGRVGFRQRFESTHRRASWRRRCRFHGVLADGDVERLYRDCTLLVAPSLYESFGLIYLEAMRWGKPVIGCRSGGVAEVVRDGETGLLVPPGDPEALLDAIDRLLDDRELCRRLGENGRRLIETDFSPRLMAERTAAFYRDVLDGAANRVRPGLADLVEDPIDLDDANRVRFSGDWEVVRDGHGVPYRVSTTPGSSLHVRLPAPRPLVFRFMGNPWSGIVSCDRGGTREYCDLYRPEKGGAIRWQISTSTDAEEVTCTLGLEREANPRTEGRQMWVERVTTCRPNPGENSTASSPLP